MVLYSEIHKRDLGLVELFYLFTVLSLKAMKILIRPLLISLVFATSAVAESKPCTPESEVYELTESVANAGIVANSLKRPQSVNAEVERLLNHAFAEVDKVTQPDSLCENNCSEDIHANVIFSSVPRQVLETKSAKQECRAYSDKEPFTLQPTTFSSQADLTTFLGDFSRGKGEQGGKLYKYCPGSCSPRYRYKVRKNGESYTLSAQVTCGMPRDTSDNQYVLKTSYRWDCS